MKPSIHHRFFTGSSSYQSLVFCTKAIYKSLLHASFLVSFNSFPSSVLSWDFIDLLSWKIQKPSKHSKAYLAGTVITITSRNDSKSMKIVRIKPVMYRLKINIEKVNKGFNRCLYIPSSLHNFLISSFPIPNGVFTVFSFLPPSKFSLSYLTIPW